MNKELLSPDLKVDHFNKNLVIASRSNRSGQKSGERSCSREHSKRNSRHSSIGAKEG